MDEAPLSIQQATMIGGITHSPTPQVFNVPTQVRLSGPLDVEALRWAIEQLVARHVALRCRFVRADGVWRQQELPPGPVPLTTADLRGRLAADQDEEVAAACRALAETPFDLTRDTVPRCLLLRLDGEQWVLMLVMHHVSTDAWAIRTVFRDLSEFYRSAVTRTPPALPVPVLQCTDYARWQAAHADPAGRERRIAALRERLPGATVRVDLPTDRPRGGAPTGAGETVRIPVPRTVREAVEELARRRHTTPFSVVAAGFARWLGERTGRQEVVLVVGFANRPHLEFEPMVTFATVAVAVPLSVGAAGPFTELVSSTALGILEAIDDAVPLSQVFSETPNVLFNFFHKFGDAVRFPGVETVAVNDLAPPASRRELTFGIVQLEDAAMGYEAWMEYSGDLWDRSSALALLHDYVEFLSTVCAEARGA